MRKLFLVSIFVLFAVFGLAGSVFACDNDGICEAGEKCDCQWDCPPCTLGTCNPFLAAANPITGCVVTGGTCDYDPLCEVDFVNNEHCGGCPDCECEIGEECFGGICTDICVIDGTCDLREKCTICPWDCDTCGAGICDPTDPAADDKGCVGNCNGNTICEMFLGEKCDCVDCDCPSDGYKCDPSHPLANILDGCYVPPISCGDGFCSFLALPFPGEKCDLCPSDCISPGPGYKCDPVMAPINSGGWYIPPFDCTDNFCSFLAGEDCNLCLTDCACPPNMTCVSPLWPGADDFGCVITCNNDGVCDHSSPGIEDCTNCFDCDCGAGVCDPAGASANPDTGCIPPCGDGVCQTEEDCEICWWDCPCDGGYDCVPGAAAAIPATCVPSPVPPDEWLDPLTNATTFEELIYDIINTIFYFAVILAPILFIIAGFYFITAGENPSRVSRAKYIAGWTAAGLLVILIAKGIIEAIRQIIGTI